MNPTENLLRKSGYQILGKNQKESIIIHFDGKDHLGNIEAEYTVKKDGKSYVAVVGKIDPLEEAARSRLIEYDRAFGLNGILLVDPEKNEIREISLKFPRERGIDFYFQFFIALFIIAIVIGIIWLMVTIKLF